MKRSMVRKLGHPSATKSRMKVFGHIRCGNRARIAAVVLAILCLAAGTVAEAQTNNTSNAATNNSTAVLTNSAAVAETNSAASVQTNTAAVAQTNTPSATQTNGAPAETKTETTATESNPEKEYNNWVEFGLGNFFVSGDKGSFQQR